ncbi:S9 family peptidase [Salsuginibacillus kocurii]|uniref:S9 family peptidase n=1 Tax=Salsuginibacillus kocurii TaxID=427078 RepID=UPI00036F0A70|nr:S9 family peptidase [Salsuginibacillus kocurii]
MGRNKRPMQAEDLLNISVVGELTLSPDGKTYMYTEQTVNEDHSYQKHLFMQPLDPNQEARQWTFGDVKDSHPAYSPAGDTIAFLSNRSGKNQIWILPVHGGEPQQLTHLKHGAGAPKWSPDGKSIYFSAPLAPDEDINSTTHVDEQKDEKQLKPLVVETLKYKSDSAGFHDEKRQQLVLCEVENGSCRKLTNADADHTPGSFSPDGRMVTFTANRERDADERLCQDVYTLDLITSDITRLTDSTGMYVQPVYSPDGSKIACLGHEYEFDGATINQIWIIDPVTKKRTCMTEKWDVQLGDAMIGDLRSVPNPGPVWSKSGDNLLFTASDHGFTGLYQIDMEGEITTVYQEDNHVFTFGLHKESGKTILGVSDPSNPGDYFLLSPEEKGKRRLTDVNANFLKEVHVSIPEPITAKAEDGWEINGWILRPVDFDETRKYPLVLEIHGGPHAMYGQTFFHELQLLAAKGYVVLYTNPRGSHGYGQRFVDAVRGDYGGKDYTDLMSAVDHVLNTYDFIDQHRLGVTGGSYGGFMTNWIVSHTTRFKAAVTQRSISNWISFFGVSDIGFFFTKWEIGHHLLENPDKLWEHSPLKYAGNIETPLLILHGERDFRCPIEQAEQLYITLKHRGNEVKFVRFPEANHELSRSGQPALRLERLNHITTWFETHL